MTESDPGCQCAPLHLVPANVDVPHCTVHAEAHHAPHRMSKWLVIAAVVAAFILMVSVPVLLER